MLKTYSSNSSIDIFLLNKSPIGDKLNTTMTKVIKVLGSGCPKCQTMTGVVKEVIAENNIDATIEKVEDVMEIMKFDVMITPALVVDGVVTIKGRIPSKDEVLQLLN